MSKKLVQFTSQQDVQLIPSGLSDKYLKRTSDNSGWELITGSLGKALYYGNTTDGYNIDLNLGSYIYSSDGYVVVNDVLDVIGEIRTGQGLVLTEQTSRPDNGTSTTGVIWVRDDNKLIFTDQNNNDNVLDTGSFTGVAISKNSGSTIGTRPKLNFIEGSNSTLTITDDAGNGEVDITISSVPTSPIRSIQFNNSGAFDGSGDFTFNTSSTSRVIQLSSNSASTTEVGIKFKNSSAANVGHLFYSELANNLVLQGDTLASGNGLSISVDAGNVTSGNGGSLNLSAGTAGSGNGGSVTIQSGGGTTPGTVTFQSGTVVSGIFSSSTNFTSATNGQALVKNTSNLQYSSIPAIFNWGNSSVSNTTTNRFLSPNWVNAIAGTTTVQVRSPVNCVIRNLHIRHGTGAGNGNNIVYTLRVNGVNSSLSVSLASTSQNGQDTTNSATVSQGDLLDIIVTKAVDITTSPTNITASVYVSVL